MATESDRQQLYALTEIEIMLQLEDETLAQAESLYEEDRVIESAVQDASLLASVADPVRGAQTASFSIADDEITIGCTCGHRGPDICAHVGAMLLAWVRDPEEFEGYTTDHLPAEREPPPPTSLEDEYRGMLAQQTIKDLRALAARRGIEIKGTRKEPIVKALAAALCDPASIQAQVARLDEPSLQLLIYLHLILDHGYGLTSEHIINGLTTRRGDLTRRVLHKQVADLAEQGLLLTFRRDGTAYYTLPQVVRVSLPPQPGFIPIYPEQKLGQLEVRERSATLTIQSLYAVWNDISEHHPHRRAAPSRLQIEDHWPQLRDWNHLPQEVQALSQRRRNPYDAYNVSMTVPAAGYRLRSAEQSALRAQTGQTDEELEFYCTLLEGLDAIRAAPGEAYASRQTAFEVLLSLPPSMQMHAVMQTWIMTTAWSEMDILLRAHDDIRLRRNLTYATYKPENLYEEWRAARHAVLRFLSTLQEEQWVSVEGFLRTIYEISPRLIHSQSDSAVWWLESSRTRRQFGTTFEDWQESSGRFVLAMLEGPLAWFGAVSLGYLASKLVAFKVTPAGSFAIQRRVTLVEAEPQDVPQDAVRLEEDLTVTLMPGHVRPQFHDLLHLIGDLEEATPQRFRYRITAEGVLLALEHGQTIERLLNQIGAWSSQEIPAAWQETLHAWSENYGRLHIYDDITLIELADDYVLQELLSNTSLREHLIYEFSPRLVAIHPDAVDGLLQEMEKRGYTPHVE